MNKKLYLCILFLLLAACTPKKVNFEELVLVTRSDTMQLSAHKAANSSVYIVARRGENNLQDLHAAVEQNIRQKGYNLATNPSLAGYIIHIAVPSMGTFNDGQLKKAVQDGYGEPISQSSLGQDVEKKLAIVADVLVVARIVPAEVRRRPAVVSTTSKPSKVAEDSARIVAAVPENEAYTIAEARPSLIQNIAQNIATTLP